ncbi:NAD(P)-binding protein, partial [Trichodelitschia bisporula]
RVILVTGATGRQGGAVVSALKGKFTVLGVTRSPESDKARGLGVQLVEGDLDNVPALFDAAAAVTAEPIWGVFSVQVSLGKGVTVEREIRQGKALVDESVRRGVRMFVYASVNRGPTSWGVPTPIAHFGTKNEVEQHLRDATAGMGWAIVRPVAFMDNLAPGFATRVFLSALKQTLGDKSLQWVATRDIGTVVSKIFAAPENFNHKAISLAGDELNVDGICASIKHVTGQDIAPAWWGFGAALMFVPEVGRMVRWFADEGYAADVNECRELHPEMMDFKAWLRKDSLW